jgi:hypothetical protein
MSYMCVRVCLILLDQLVSFRETWYVLNTIGSSLVDSIIHNLMLLLRFFSRINI